MFSCQNLVLKDRLHLDMEVSFGASTINGAKTGVIHVSAHNHVNVDSRKFGILQWKRCNRIV